MILDALSAHIALPAYWVCRRIDVRKELKGHLQNQWRSPDELAMIQWNGLQKLLTHAYENVPYYRSLMQKIGCRPEDIKTLEDFSKLPYLTKEDIVRHRDSLIAKNFRKERLIPDSTGGSTGRNIQFFEDRNELAHRFAAAAVTDSWAGLVPGVKYVQIWGSPLDFHKSGKLRQLRDRFLLRRLFFSSFDLSDDRLASISRKIRKFKPLVMVGYPTPLFRLARFFQRTGETPWNLKSIISSAETLYPDQRAEIEQTFGCEIFDRYGCREFGVIAAECEHHNGLHLLVDRFVVEFTKPEPLEGSHEAQEVIITDLHKFAMPFIRYRIGDLAVRSDKSCECGRGLPIIQRIEGRTFDLIVGTNGNFVGGTFWTLLFRRVPGIDLFQVHQPSLDRLEIRLEVNPAFRKDSISFLKREIRKRCGENMRIAFKLMDKIQQPQSGKHRFITSDVSAKYLQ